VVRFRLLGTVEADHDGQNLDIGHARQRCVLAVLLLDANNVVSVEQLLERSWGERVPQRSRGTLYSYLSRLRSVLTIGEDVRLTRRSGGYLLTVDPLAVDLHRFHHLLAQARAVDDSAAAPLYRQALALCRGPAFATLDTPWLNATRDITERHRIAATLDHNDVWLRCGRHQTLLPELASQAAASPLDERLAGQLMLVLYRCGRQAEALRAYHALSARLADDLGVDPAQELRQLHTAIIRKDPELSAPRWEALVHRA
jgi:DNA-binding SARP family transcriptional activator